MIGKDCPFGKTEKCKDERVSGFKRKITRKEKITLYL